MQEDWREALSWSWQQKVADFQKPGDDVLVLSAQTDLGQLPKEKYQLVLSRERVFTAEELLQVHGALQKNGFFLCEQPGGEDCRRMAELLCPGCRPATPQNLEHCLPQFAAAGFRVMFRDQAYPQQRFSSVSALEEFVLSHPTLFGGGTEEQFVAHLPQLHALWQKTGNLTVERHVFLLIGKKR